MTPSKFHTAYNPIIFTFNQIESETFTELDVIIGGTTVNLIREYINGVATFDISNIIQAYFASKLVDSINPSSANVFVEPKLYVTYQVGGVTYIAVNGVVQIGETLNYSRMRNKSLTTLNSIKYYDSYPLDISVLCEEPITAGGVTTFRDAINRIVVSQAGVISTDVLNLLTEGDNVQNGGDNVILGTIVLDTAVATCIPSQPFYVRWINYKGGVDYFMFEYNQKRNVSLVENQTYKNYISDYLNENGTDNSFFKKAIEVISVGAGLLDATTYNALVKMTLSPFIEVYDGVWKRIIIEQSSQQRETKDTLNSFECNFLLPELNLQY